MIKKMNALGDRVLGMLLPSSSADAASCRGTYLGYFGCDYYCYRYGVRSTKYKLCSTATGCQVVCYDCC